MCLNSDGDLSSGFKKLAGEFLKKNAGRFFGGAAGFVVAVLILTIGLWRTVLIVALVFTGACIGGGRGRFFGRLVTWYRDLKR